MNASHAQIAAARRHILRRDLLAQLRTATRPLATTDLRLAAPVVPLAGSAVAFLPTHEQVYRVLRSLQRRGLVTRGPIEGRHITWSAAPRPADDKIAALEAAIHLGLPGGTHL